MPERGRSAAVIAEFFVQLVGEAVVEIIGEGIKAPFASRQRRTSRMWCSMRVESGDLPGFPARSWRRRNARLAAGSIQFGRVDVRILSIAVRPDVKYPDWLQGRGTDRTCAITTPGGVILWAVPRHLVDWALTKVGQPVPDPTACMRGNSS